MLAMRPYQREAVQRVRDAYRAGRRRVLVSLPTGTGKTVIFAHFPSELRMQKRLLVLAHREELLVQARDKFLEIDPSLRVEIEQAGARASPEAKVVVASVATLARSNGTRLSRLPPDDFSIVVVDEAHHAVAPTYRKVFDHFGLFESDMKRLLVGFTATPRRGDRQGLGDVFEEVCYARDLRGMIGDAYLAPIAGWRVDTGVSLDGVRLRHGDFVESQLASVVNTPERNREVVRAYRDLAGGRRAIVFCVDVAHAHAVHEAFEETHVRAGAVWGAMPKEERRARLADFSAGAFDVVTNCNLLTEGFDEPRVDCIIMARPTRSRLLYAQMVGRGTRLHPDKNDLLVIDVADNSLKHELPGLHTLFDLPSTLNLSGRDALVVGREIEQLQRTYPWVDTTRIRTPEQIQVALERIDFFNFDPPPELVDLTANTWYAVPDGYRLSLAKGAWLSVNRNLLDGWDVDLTRPGNGESAHHSVRTLRAAVELADRFAAAEFPDAARLIERDARWRDRPPTEKQRETLARRGIPLPDGVTRGQAAQIISMVISTRGR